MSNSLDDPRVGPNGLKPPFKDQDGKQDVELDPKPDFGEDSYVGHNKLSGKVAIITGGDSGIGKAVVVAFAREGADIVIAYHSSDDDAKETAAVVEKSGRQALLWKGDISDDKNCSDLIEKAMSKFGRIDILVNNAAFQGESLAEGIKDKKMDNKRVIKTFHTNIISMFSLVQYAVPHLKPGSSIINVASIQGYQPSFEILDYACTKGAIITFTHALAQQLIKDGIRVNAVAPGPVWTPLVVKSFSGDKLKHFGEQYPIGRPAQPSELAGAFVYLASNDARYTAGEVIGVTGGKHIA